MEETFSTQIKVTAVHIKQGEPNEPCLCPVALAVSEALCREFEDKVKDLVAVNVFRDKILLRAFIGKPYYIARLNKDVSARIDSFDKHGPMEPFEFEAVFDAIKTDPSSLFID